MSILFWVRTPCGLVGGYHVYREYVASIVRVKKEDRGDMFFTKRW
jgi:hypothetical protein